ncbi:hypothetical protein CC2G_002968 [Coprinopsis cinerea AmutBmut pab1-1]|nr:hypothetical protein CC2G_002968 [Coprinopsis cinerea AmutBmut pab1-1]
MPESPHKQKCPICEKTFKSLVKHTPACRRKLEGRLQEEQLERELRKADEARRQKQGGTPAKVRTLKPWEDRPIGKQRRSNRKEAPELPQEGGPATLEQVLSEPLPEFLGAVDAEDNHPQHPSVQAPPSPHIPVSEPSALRNMTISGQNTILTPKGQLVTTRLRIIDDSIARRPILPRANIPLITLSLPKLIFEFGELALRCCLNQKQISAFLSLFHRCMKGDDKLTIETYDDLSRCWREASQLLTPIKCDTIPATYKNEKQEFKLYSRSLWDWALDLVKNEELAPFFEWDAQRLFKYDEKRARWIRFINEPWTADSFYDVQSSLPAEGKPLAFLLYADKTELSSFGGEKGYPVYARLANLPIDIRNGSESVLGGGRVVGWLPVPKETSKKKASKKDYADWKRVVWHDSFKKLLDTIRDHAKNGCWVRCGDGIERFLFPAIIILSADYEEQCTMANIRGAGSLSPCPICLVKADEMLELTKSNTERDVAQTESMVSEALTKGVTEQDKFLKPDGLRPVKNAFSNVANSNPFRALSFDRLHSYANGLGAKHLWVTLLKHIEDNYGMEKLQELEDRARSFPSWQGLNRFNKVLSTKYQDGNKNEDLMKVALFIAFNIFPPQDKVGHELLKCIRHFLNLDILASFTNHTEDTIQEISDELGRFEVSLKRYISLTPEASKNWAFPKIHAHTHLPRDIYLKGVTRNYNTKPNEGMHPILKDFYRFMTNFKNFEGKILELEHWCYTAAYIRSKIDMYHGRSNLIDPDSDAASDIEGDVAQKDSENLSLGSGDVIHVIDGGGLMHRKKKETTSNVFGNISLGSPQKPVTLQLFVSERRQDPRFKGFRSALGTYISAAIQSGEIPSTFSLHDTTLIHEFCFVKTFYECRVTWELDVTLLRCNPDYQHHARYDPILLDGDDITRCFARLVSTFTIDIPDLNRTLPLAFVELYDGPVTEAQRRKDRELGLLRVCRKPRTSGHFVIISTNLITRGVLLVPAFGEREENYLVFDVSDGDMFLRVKDFIAR